MATNYFSHVLASGPVGVTGLGLGHSREKWGLLPNPHTDFIFTIVGEELGLVGTLAVLALFVAFLMVSVAHRPTVHESGLPTYRGGHHPRGSRWRRSSIFLRWWAGGRLTGVPLPFFSYGGTALITELAAVGLLYNIAHDRSRSGDLTLREYRLTNFRDAIERPRGASLRRTSAPSATPTSGLLMAGPVRHHGRRGPGPRLSHASRG